MNHNQEEPKNRLPAGGKPKPPPKGSYPIRTDRLVSHSVQCIQDLANEPEVLRNIAYLIDIVNGADMGEKDTLVLNYTNAQNCVQALRIVFALAMESRKQSGKDDRHNPDGSWTLEL